MARPKKWPEGTTKSYKLKLDKVKADQYKKVLDAKAKTIQQDFEDHVDQTIN